VEELRHGLFLVEAEGWSEDGEWSSGCFLRTQSQMEGIVEPSRVVRACLWERAWGGVCNGRGVAAQAREMRDQKTTREAMRRGSPVFPGRADRMESRRRDTAQNSTAEAGSRKGDIGIRQQPTPLLSHSEDATLPSLWAKLVNRQAGAGTGAGLLPGVLGGAR
jgi:hypothetical protein